MAAATEEVVLCARGAQRYGLSEIRQCYLEGWGIAEIIKQQKKTSMNICTVCTRSHVQPYETLPWPRGGHNEGVDIIPFCSCSRVPRNSYTRTAKSTSSTASRLSLLSARLKFTMICSRNNPYHTLNLKGGNSTAPSLGTPLHVLVHLRPDSRMLADREPSHDLHGCPATRLGAAPPPHSETAVSDK